MIYLLLVLVLFFVVSFFVSSSMTLIDGDIIFMPNGFAFSFIIFSLFFFKKGEEKDAWLIIDCYKQGETAEGEQIIIMGEIINVWMK